MDVWYVVVQSNGYEMTLPKVAFAEENSLCGWTQVVRQVAQGSQRCLGRTLEMEMDFQRRTGVQEGLFDGKVGCEEV